MLRRQFLTVVIVQQLVSVCSAATTTERVRIDPVSGNFVGKDGRTRTFHGVNVVQKSFPWHPSLGEFNQYHSLNAEDMANLKSWGFNAVRLGMMWPGVEPSEGQYNSTYLKVMRQIVDDLYSHGIYTIVDFHQDSLSEEWCGEGIPAWMVPMLGPLMNSCHDGLITKIGRIIGQCKTFSDFHISIDPATGFPNTKECQEVTFDAYSRTPELVSAWGHFYHSEVIQKKFQAFWQKVATEFVGAPGLIGYDLINEPLNGNFWTQPDYLLPGHHDREVLQPMYKALHDVIREVDSSAIIMYEPPPFPDTYPDNIPALKGVHSMGATSGPAGKDVAHQALSYHIYSCGFALAQCARTGDTPSPTCDVCDTFADAAVSTRDKDRKRLGGGVFLTEFGACSGSEACVAEIDRVLSQAEDSFHSWAYWQFKYNHDITTVSGKIEGFYQDDGTLQHAKVAALSRTYAPAVAGLPRLAKFDMKTGAFRLQYESEQSTLHLPTEVFLNQEMNYKKSGYVVSAVNALVQANGTNQLAVVANAANLQVDVAITRPYDGETTGRFRTANEDIIAWDIADSEDSPGFEFTTLSNVTWWKALKVYTDSGELLCSLSTQDQHHGPEQCNFAAEHKHDFLFGYRIEIWKAKFLGIHSHVDTIQSSRFGPLLKKRIRFTWIDDDWELKAAARMSKDEEVIV